MTRVVEGESSGGFDGTTPKDIQSHIGITAAEILGRQFDDPEGLPLSTSPLHIQQFQARGYTHTMVIVDCPITGDGLNELYYQNAPDKTFGRDRQDIIDDHRELGKRRYGRRDSRLVDHMRLPGFPEYYRHKDFFTDHIEGDNGAITDAYNPEKPAIYPFLSWRKPTASQGEYSWKYDEMGSRGKISKALQYKRDFAHMRGIADLRYVNTVTGASVLAYLSPEFWDSIKDLFKDNRHGYNMANPVVQPGFSGMRMTPNSAAALPLVYMDELMANSNFPPAVESFMASQGRHG